MGNYYEILGVRPKADHDQVRSAYRKLAREYHPDVNPDPKAHEFMAQINVAFEVLSDPVRRMEYDATLGHVAAADRESDQDETTRPDAVRIKIFRRLRAHKTPVYAVGFVKDTDSMVTTAFDNEAFWWNESIDYPDQRYKFEGGVVNAMSVVDASHIVAAGSTEQNLNCWVYKDGKAKGWRQNPKQWICCVAPSPDGQSLACGSVSSLVKVVRATDGVTRFVGETHDDAVTALAWAQDSSLLATGSVDTNVKIWCGATGKELDTVNRVVSTVTAIAFSPDNRWLAVAGVDLSLRIFDTNNMSLRKTFFGHTRPIESLAFHPFSGLLASGSRDGTVGLWNVRQGVGHGRIDASHHPISCVSFSGGGRYLVSGGLDKVLRIWRIGEPGESGEPE